MAKVKKLGTFGGVFTPSILTILGVIMYLRFPTIIGQAGLVNTIGIIVIAHIISITTSLSVASLSTDKTIKTGGTYFMISRSLGLPIGGTLGFALFVGLSFSVSLYLIGFAESFLSYWNMDTSINSVRITGTIILIVVTTITFISTSLAIKSQYFIMVAIFLSLLSIFLGNHEFTPREINFKPLADAAPFMILFGIFFPAVTGFEAGVSMSGDLKDPKKSLPVGAMAAVGVGFVVYIGLAFFYAYTVDSEVLMNDNQILFKIALVPALVIIGILGATLSSALGSILGAPRILQAIAMDKIAPKFFAKGTGKTNEPRNALLLAFIIAEAGILIGQLDVIARIVSMFFITTYAFLNLACAIESWSSSDFRPAFKIPKFVSITGAIAAFIVMILLDFIALAGAVIVLGLLLFFLRRKELSLETGDAWSSFWTNLAKRSLLKLSTEKTDTRNWRPNIILFRGKKQERVHLVELGLAMSGKLGALTDFELIINGGTKTASVEHKDIARNGLQYFSRQLECETIEDGIKSVTKIYGFSGFEPNTVFMGWSHEPKNAGLLATIFTDLKKKNLNAAFLDYDIENGYGKKENIDIWWNGKGRFLSFALNLTRFLLSDPDWRDSHVRIMIINSNNQTTDKLYRNTNALLNERRIEADVKIINDDFGTRNKEIIIKNESTDADLVIIGISPNPDYYTEKYIEEFNRISEVTSSLLILGASDEFEEINLIESARKIIPAETQKELTLKLPALPIIENKLLLNRIESIDDEMLEFTGSFFEKGFNRAVEYQKDLILKLKDNFEFNIDNTKKLLDKQQGTQLTKSINKNHQAFLDFTRDFFDKQSKQAILLIKEVLENELAVLKTKTGNYIFETPETIIIPVIKDSEQKERNISVQFRKMIIYTINDQLYPAILNHLLSFETITHTLYSELKQIALRTNDIYEKREINKSGFKTNIELESQPILHDLEKLTTLINNLAIECKQELFKIVRNQVIEICNDILSTQSKKALSKKSNNNFIQVIENIETFPENLELSSQKLNNAALLDFRILFEQKIIFGIIQNFAEKIQSIVSEKVLSQADLMIKNIEDWKLDESTQVKNTKFPNHVETKLMLQDTYLKIVELLERLPKEIEICNADDFDEDPNKNVQDAIIVNPHKIARYYLDTKLYDPLYRELEQLDLLVNQSIIQYKEANTLLKFKLENTIQEQEKNIISDENLNEFLLSIEKQINTQNEKLLGTLDQIKYKADELIINSLSPLYSHAIIESHNKLSVLLREQKGKKFGVAFSKNVDRIKENWTNLIVNLLYSSSYGMIRAKKYLKKRDNAKVEIGQILDLAEKEIANPKVFSLIPVFYRTLFSSKSLINDDLWIPMELELSVLKNALQRHKNGLGGAILITGVHGSGKTTLTRYFASHNFKKGQYFYIHPTTSGSAKTEDWLNQLQLATGIRGNSNEILSSLPHGSAVIINDLEMWWERTNEGYSVLHEINNSIRIFGKKILFLIISNKYSFNQINRVFPLEDNLLQTIECEPFDAKRLQQLIQIRHNTSGLTYHYKNDSEDKVSQISTAALFGNYFKYSGGIPGVAINAWISNITKIDKGDIFINKPELPETNILNNINPEWQIIIALFIQHKLMNATKLASVMNIPINEAENHIYNLTNARILEQCQNDVYELGRNIEPFLVKICHEKGII